jgi:hypothetical protein
MRIFAPPLGIGEHHPPIFRNGRSREPIAEVFDNGRSSSSSIAGGEIRVGSMALLEYHRSYPSRKRPRGRDTHRETGALGRDSVSLRTEIITLPTLRPAGGSLHAHRSRHGRAASGAAFIALRARGRMDATIVLSDAPSTKPVQHSGLSVT